MDGEQDSEARTEWEREIRTRIERYDADPDSALAGCVVFAELCECERGFELDAFVP